MSYTTFNDEFFHFCQQVGRQPSDIQVVVVSKKQPIARLQHLYDQHNIRDFGENRLEELTLKKSQMPRDVKWHFIGRIQRKKLGKLLPLKATLHSMDRMELIQSIGRWTQQFNQPVQGYIQVNISGEPSKAGFDLDVLSEVYKECKEHPLLEVLGLMTMAPALATHEACRQLFEKLHDQKFLFEEALMRPCKLSMGMSRDYKAALEAGTDCLRIGRSIFDKA